MKPTKTRPFLCAKDWGGQKLAQLFGKPLVSPQTGESWEISAHAHGESTVWDMPLSQAVTHFGKELMGDVKGDFPLLIKLLDAQQNLSVQVHPDDALARSLEAQPFGKTEAWVILSAPEEAELILGVDCTPDEMREAIAMGDMERHLKPLRVHAGDTIFIPAGTVHALTAGIVLYEVQQSSDTTYRLYAWGRDAQLHIKSSLLAMALPAVGAGPVVPTVIAQGLERLVRCDAFTLDRITPGEGLTMPSDARTFVCYTATAQGYMTCGEDRIDYHAGDSILVPASADSTHWVGGSLLKAYPTI